MKPSKSLCVRVDFSKEIVYVNQMVWLLSSNSLCDPSDLDLKKRDVFRLRRAKHFKIPFWWCIKKFTWNMHAFLFGQFFISYSDTFIKSNEICFLIDKISLSKFLLMQKFLRGENILPDMFRCWILVNIPWNSELVHFASSAFLRVKGGHRSLSNSWNPRKVCVFVLIFWKR